MRDSPWLETAKPGASHLDQMFPSALPQVAARLGRALSAADHATLWEVGAVLVDCRGTKHQCHQNGDEPGRP